MVQKGLSSADLVVAPTRAMLESLNENYPGAVKTKGLVIPNGLDVNSLTPTLKQKFVLSAGRLWDEAKNIQSLIGVAWELPWSVCLAGERQNADGGNNAVPANTNCYPLGKLPRETLRGWYACASIYVLPARYEPFGLTILEAALSGCALVLGGIESLKENWSNAAVFVNPQDRPALRNTLLELIRNEVHRKRLGETARERALQFTSTRMAEQYTEAYSGLLTNRKSKEVAACA
jgi:glycosyltransferase involved in cell wall biosynthesis